VVCCTGVFIAPANPYGGWMRELRHRPVSIFLRVLTGFLRLVGRTSRSARGLRATLFGRRFRRVVTPTKAGREGRPAMRHHATWWGRVRWTSKVPGTKVARRSAHPVANALRRNEDTWKGASKRRRHSRT
jgi:hypothetical protein